MRSWRFVSWLMVSASIFVIAALTAQQRPPDVPYVPTPHEVVREMLRVAQVGKDDVVYDLGCGDGRIVIAAVKDFGAKRGVGVDIDPERIRESNENARKAGVTDRVRFLQRDLFETDIRDATVVTLYLLPSINLRLRPKLFRELRPAHELFPTTLTCATSAKVKALPPASKVGIQTKSSGSEVLIVSTPFTTGSSRQELLGHGDGRFKLRGASASMFSNSAKGSKKSWVRSALTVRKLPSPTPNLSGRNLVSPLRGKLAGRRSR